MITPMIESSCDPVHLENTPAWKPVPLNDFRTSASVDWITFAMNCAAPTRFDAIRREIANVTSDLTGIFVTPLNPTPGGVATEYEVRIQDLKSGTQFAEIASSLERRWTLKEPLRLTGIEVSIDFWAREKSYLDAMTLRLMRSLAPAGDHPRVYDPAYRTDFHLNQVRHPLTPAQTYYNSSSDKEILWRIYGKRTDRGGTSIPADQHRSRVEVNLMGSALLRFGLSIDDLQSFRFETLNSLFHFRSLVEPEGVDPKSLRGQIAVERKKLATSGMHSCSYPPGSRRKFVKSTIADDELKSRCYDALRRLSAKFARNPAHRLH